MGTRIDRTALSTLRLAALTASAPARRAVSSALKSAQAAQMDRFDAAGPQAQASAPSCAYDGGIQYDPNVEALQRQLVSLGLMTQAQMDTGPGCYGPRTRAAVAALQRQQGIPGDGARVDPATRTALSQVSQDPSYSVPEDAPAFWPSPAMVSAPTGSGTAGGARTVAPGSTPAIAGGDGGRYPVPYINQMSSDGTADDWNASSNCGPTTMAMIAKGLGYGRDMQDGSLVNHFDEVAGVGADGVGADGIQTMASSCGFSSTVQGAPTAEWVREQLAAGNLVAANGNRSVTLQYEQPPYASGSATGGHWIAVVGVTADGNFLVQDPSTTCKVLTPAQLEEFFRAHGGDGGYAVAIGP